ncbi:hypothetical protein [Chitinophaga polysaccharea]|uniref:hypothetical protein n=1 Tax=Chitinophaga polysaccharea TaxID=1293035 RepID=UPI0011583750|nr:hypothetical protein [Chitinophaga polysaccharea]
MKIILGILMILGITPTLMTANSQSLPQADIIRGFLLNLESDNWSLDTITTRYLNFEPANNKNITTSERKELLKNALEKVSIELKDKGVNVNDLVIEKYSNADQALKKMIIPKDEAGQTYIAIDKSKNYVRYFLIEGKRIKSFTTFKDGKVFLIL